MNGYNGFVLVSPFNETLLPTAPAMKCTWSKDVPSSANPHTKVKRTKQQKVYEDIFQLIGNTPMVKLNKIPKSEGVKCNVYAKCEFFNPSGSLKDRIAKRMIEDAEKQGLLKPGSTIIEPSSGNTGIGIALVAAVKGYACIIIMPEKMSIEKEWIMTALGTKVIRTPNHVADIYAPNGVLGVAHRLRKEIPNSLILDQYYNPSNPLTHYDTTSEEILDQLDNKVDMIVMGGGTGGTLTGIGRKFKEVSPHTQIIGVDPEGSYYALPEILNETKTTSYQVEGIGHLVVPPTMDRNVVTKWFKSNDPESMIMARRLVAEEGLLCGGSSGAIVSTALKAAKDLPEDKNVVVILPDGVRNYMTKFISTNWMEAQKYLPSINHKNMWWWDISVSSLKPKEVPILTSDTSCQNTLNKFKSHEVNVAFVIQKQENNFIGVLTRQRLNRQLISGNVSVCNKIEQIISRIYPKVEESASLGLLSRILEIEDYVVVTQDNTKAPKPIGVLDSSDLLDYIARNQPKS